MSLQRALRDVAKRNPRTVAEAFRLLAADLDDQEEREERMHRRNLNDSMSDWLYGGGE